jgi:hypothetical protein
MKRVIVVFVAAIACVSWACRAWAGPPATAPGAAAAPLLTAAEAKDCDAVLATMVGAGFPDAAGASVYAGPIAVSATYDPAKTPPPLPTEASNTQETHGGGSTDVTYGYQFDGLHLKLADGSWVIAMRYRFRPGKDDKVDVSNATAVHLATATADALADKPFDAATRAATFLSHIPAADRPRATAVMDVYVPATTYLRIRPDDMAPAAVLLARAGWADAAGLSLAIGQQRARSYWQLRPWTAADFPFDPTGAYADSKAEEAAWATAHAEAAPEPPAVALRRALFRWCRAQVTLSDPEDAMLPPAAAAAAARAAVDPGDPQHNGAKVDALLAGMKLPVNPPEHAPLVDRLQSWEGRPRQPRMVVTGGGGANPTIGTSFQAPPPAYAPDKGDLDALVALLADARPSRFNDFSGPRTAGDNAWRALAELLHDDPRTLAGYPTDHPWTDAERTAAATAVQAWWKDHRLAYVGK